MKPITKVYVRVIGDTAAGLPHQDFQLDVFVDLDALDECDHASHLFTIRSKIMNMYELMSGEYGHVRVLFDYELPVDPPFQDIKTGLIYEPYVVVEDR
jgi:hypothetical protein